MSGVIEFDAERARSVDLMYQTSDVVSQRARTIAALAPKLEDKVLDVGAGPGLLLQDIASLVGSAGRAVGIDVSEAMVKMAATRVANIPHASSAIMDAKHLDFEPDYFDAVVSTQVLEYVLGVDEALSSFARVLKPGGRCIIVDTDWDSVVMNTKDHGRMERFFREWDKHLVDPFLPSKLPPLLKAAGFNLVDTAIIPMLRVGWQPHSYAGYMWPAMVDYVRRNGNKNIISDDEINAFVLEQEKLKDRGEFFFSLNRYQFVAIKK